MNVFETYLNECLNGLEFCFKFLSNLGELGNIVLIVVNVVLVAFIIKVILERVVDV